MRVVSLTCSNTEIICALGLQDMLVGTDDHSDYPKDVVDVLPRVGPDLQIDLDAVEALQPDLVLASLTVPGHEQIVEGIEARGLPFLAPEPTSLDHLFRDIRDIADAVGHSKRGVELADDLRRRLPEQPLEGPGTRVLVEWWPKPVIAPGRHSWVTVLLTLAGGVNPLGNEDHKSRPVTDAEVVQMDPEAVVISWCGVPTHRYRVDVVEKREAWASTTALRHGQIYPVPESFLGRPGPRLVDGFEALRSVVLGAAAAVR